MELTNEEFNRFLHLRALEWANLPAFISSLYAPILLIYLPWFVVLIIQVLLGLGWCIMRYKNPRLQNATRYAIWVGKGQWPIAVAGFIGLVIRHKFILAFVALGWPLLSGVFTFGGRTGIIEQKFLENETSAI